jgi:hypothetical protein
MFLENLMFTRAPARGIAEQRLSSNAASGVSAEDGRGGV